MLPVGAHKSSKNAAEDCKNAARGGVFRYLVSQPRTHKGHPVARMPFAIGWRCLETRGATDK